MIRGRGVITLAVALMTAGACAKERDQARDVQPDALDIAARVVQGDRALSAMLAPRDDGFAEDPRTAQIVSRSWRENRGAALAVRAPRTADDDVELGGASGMRLRVTLVGARNSAAIVRGGRVVYPGVLPHVDRILAVDESSLEDALVLTSPASTRAFTWKLQLPPAVKSVTPRAGGLTLRGERDRELMAIAPPFALDARGTKRPLTLAWDDAASTMHLDVDTRDLAYPVVVDPRVETWAWRKVSSELRRYGHAMAYDAARSELVSFGGYDGRATNAETWTWNGAGWRIRQPAHSPSPRSFACAAYDAARGNVVLFGGENDLAGETWTWDGTDWTKHSPLPSPPARRVAACGYDGTRHTVLLSGGRVATGPLEVLNDTWTWNGSAWTELHPTVPAPALAGAAFAFDDVRGTAVLFGGYGRDANGGSFFTQDTWTWNGITWRQESPAHNPGLRIEASAAHDARRGKTVVFGGMNVTAVNSAETWEWDGVDWTQRAVAGPRGRLDAALAYDASVQKLVLFAGRVNATGADDTWFFDGTAWTLAPPSSPFPRAYGVTAFDEVRGELVVVGGENDDGLAADTWTWDGTAWTRHAVTPRPPNFSLGAGAFDPVSGNVVVFGGYDNAGEFFGVTWLWNGSAWVQASGPSPNFRACGSMTYDSARRRIVLTGGHLGSIYFDDTWLWDGAHWTNAAPMHRPPRGRCTPFAFDEARGRATLFADLAAPSTWDGTDWSQVPRLSVAPPPRTQQVAVYDRAHRVTLMFGGFDGIEDLSDSWLWDGAAWQPLSFGSSPIARYGALAAYDASRKHITLLGGGSGDGWASDVWVLDRLGATCQSAADCPSNTFCTDGVCCNVQSCGTCQTCAGLTVGACSAVTNVEDADSCGVSRGLTCNGTGDCKSALGVEATQASDCASGFLVDGICCDTACNGPCQACRIDRKESNERTGVCGNAKPASCVCASNADCAPFHRCESGVCAVDRGATCDDQNTLLSATGERTDCGLYKCQGAMCLATCTSNQDCTRGADCSPERACVSFAPVTPPSGGCGGCAVSHGAASDQGEPIGSQLALALFATVLSGLSRARARRSLLRNAAVGSLRHASDLQR